MAHPRAVAISDSTRFRSHWTPEIKGPNPQHFLPVPPPQQPKQRDVPPPEPQPVTKERLTEPPPEAYADGCLIIRDRYNDYRAYISADGTCTNNAQEILGYIEMSSGEAGSAEGQYLGCLKIGTTDDQYYVEDSLDEVFGLLDIGKATLSYGNGTTVAEVDNAGCLKGHMLSYLGQFEGFTFHDLKKIALYCFLIDPGILNEVEG